MHYYPYPNSLALNKFSNSIFSTTKHRMKKLYSMSSVYFFTLSWPLVDSTTITGTPCVPKRKGREKTVQEAKRNTIESCGEERRSISFDAGSQRDATVLVTCTILFPKHPFYIARRYCTEIGKYRFRERCARCLALCLNIHNL